MPAKTAEDARDVTDLYFTCARGLLSAIRMRVVNCFGAHFE